MYYDIHNINFMIFCTFDIGTNIKYIVINRFYWFSIIYYPNIMFLYFKTILNNLLVIKN